MALALPAFGADLFLDAGEAARRGDLPKALEAYRQLAASGSESASLYWNWSQVAARRGQIGEAIWALARGRELDPADEALARELDHLRDLANLDPAEIDPDPLAGLRRFVGRWHFGLVATVLLGLSVVAHGVLRLSRTARWPATAAWSTLALGLAVAAPLLATAAAKNLAVVARRGAPMLDAASPQAGVLGPLREGEVVVVLAESRGYLRVQDSSGARGWATAAEVWRLDQPVTTTSAASSRTP